jgi:hypothetical protein
MSDQKFEASWPTMPPTLEEAVARPDGGLAQSQLAPQRAADRIPVRVLQRAARAGIEQHKGRTFLRWQT